MITSDRSFRAQVAEWRSRSISSLTAVVFSILLDIGVAGGDVGLRLVVIVIGNEILHRRVGEEPLELGTELSRQGLVVSEDQRGLLDPLYDLGHGVGLAGAGDA